MIPAASPLDVRKSYAFPFCLKIRRGYAARFWSAA
jgi:hypothetical protein